MPSDWHASEAVDSTLAEPVAAAVALSSTLQDSHNIEHDSQVPELCTVTACYYVLGLVLCGLLQVPAAASSRAGDLPPQATRGAQDLPSNAWLDTTESIPVDSDRHHDVEPTRAGSPTGAASRLRTRPRLGTLKIEPTVAAYRL